MARGGGVALALVVVVAGATACRDGTTAPTEVSLGEAFGLRVGQSAAVRGADLELGLQEVASDSRCPEDVQCITEGDAAVRVWLTPPRGERSLRELHTSAPRGAEADWGAFRLRLLGLAPRPRTDRPLRPQDYLATFAVTRR